MESSDLKPAWTMRFAVCRGRDRGPFPRKIPSRAVDRDHVDEARHRLGEEIKFGCAPKIK